MTWESPEEVKAMKIIFNVGKTCTAYEADCLGSNADSAAYQLYDFGSFYQ